MIRRTTKLDQFNRMPLMRWARTLDRTKLSAIILVLGGFTAAVKPFPNDAYTAPVDAVKTFIQDNR